MADYSTTANVVLTVNGNQAQKMLAELESQAKELKEKFDKAKLDGDTKEAQKIERALRRIKAEMNQITTATKTVGDVLKNLDSSSLNELNKAAGSLKRQLKNLKPDDAGFKEKAEQLRAINERIKEVNDSLKTQQTTWQKFTGWVNNAKAAVLGLVGSLAGLMATAKNAVDAFSGMEQEMANVRKYTGMTSEEVESLNEAFKNMDTRTSREDLNKLAQEAGRLGKTSVEDVLGFVRAADQINVALDDLGDGATLTLSKLTGIFGDEKRLGTEKALLSVGSVINELSQNCSAAAPYLTDFTSRLGGVGAQAGMTVQQIMSFAAVLDSSQAPLEKSATALQQLIVKMLQEPAKYAQAAGLEVKSFSELVKTDMNKALITFLESLSKVGKMDALAPLFEDMQEKGSGTVATLATLTEHIEEVKNQQLVANQAFEEGISITNEFNVQNGTVAASLDKSKKSLHDLMVELGEKLIPIITLANSSARIGLEVLNNLVDFVKEYWKVLLSLTAAIAAYSVVSNFATIKTKAFAAAQAMVNAASGLQRSTMLLLNAAYALMTGNVTKATRVMHLFNASIKSNPVGLLISALTAAAGAVWYFATRTNKAKEEMEAFKKEIRDIDKTSAAYSAQEIERLDRLYKVATDEKKSRDARIGAVKEMQELYPAVFGNLETESILVGDAKDKYDALRESIISTAKARAAQEKITENSRQLLELELRKKTLDSEIEDLNNRRYKAQSEFYNSQDMGSPSGYNAHYAGSELQEIDKGLKERNVELSKNIEQTKLLTSANNELYDSYVKTNEVSQKTENEGNIGPVGNANGEGNKAKDRFAAEKAWREKAEAEARISYRTGQMDYLQYTQRMDVIAEQFYQKQLEHAELSENERLKIKADYLDAQAKKEEDWQKATIEAENLSYGFRKSQMVQFYIDGKIEKEDYDIRMEELEIEHQRQLVRLTREGTKERIQAEQQLQSLLVAQVQKRNQEMEKLEAEYAKIKDKFFGMNDSERLQKYNEAMEKLTEVFDREIANAQSEGEIKRIKEAFEKAQEVIKKEFGFQEENPFQTMVENQIEWLESEGTQRILKSFNTIVSGMSSIFSQLSSYIQAELQLQTAQLDKYYDKEIERAEGNSYRIQKLEKEKEQKLAKIKQDANKKLFAMQVFEAVAQTAQNAISAYGAGLQIGGLAGLIMAPIAAAMATAAGMIQVAAIKKQQQAAEAQGYAEGGFTPKGPKDKEVGVVHAGEWVASQKLVNNPRTRPMIEALDYAQRTNTIGSISSRDVSRSITAPMVLAHGGASSQPNVIVNVPENPSSNQSLTHTLDKLNRRLNEPFVTVNSVTGDEGYEQAKDKYDRLIRNKSPKSKRKRK